MLHKQLDPEDIEAFLEEAFRLGSQLNVICNKLILGVPRGDGVGLMHHAVDHLKLDLSYIKFCLEEIQKRAETAPGPT